MYLYTPKKNLVQTVTPPKFGYRPSHYATVCAFVNKYFSRLTQAEKAGLTWIVQHDYPEVKYYSPFPCRTVPVRGHQFPVVLFDETVVE